MSSVGESNYELSTSDKIFTEENSLDGLKVNNQEIKGDNETSEYFAGLEERYLKSMYEQFEQIGLLKYLKDEKIYIKDTEVFQNPLAISDLREYKYYLEESFDKHLKAHGISQKRLETARRSFCCFQIDYLICFAG